MRALLQKAELVRGTLHLMFGMDRGPANRDKKLQAWMRERRVIALWNVPRTPQHNAPIESFSSEFKIELEALGELQGPGPDPSQGPVLHSGGPGSGPRRGTSECACRAGCST